MIITAEESPAEAQIQIELLELLVLLFPEQIFVRVIRELISVADQRSLGWVFCHAFFTTDFLKIK